MAELHPRAWVEIDRAALAHNIALLKGRCGPTGIMAVLKADAYGHGLSSVAAICHEEGLSDFGVATVEEGLAVRSLLPDARIHLLSAVLPDEADAIVAGRLVPLVSTREMVDMLSAASQRAAAEAEVHLDVDTGMGRAGCRLVDARALLTYLIDAPHLRLTGIATHFAMADEDTVDARAQHQLFLDFLGSLPTHSQGLTVHAGNSGATLTLAPESFHSLVRPGLLLYGIEPAPGMFGEFGAAFRPVLSLKARVTLCRPLPAGATISYGKTFAVPSNGGVFATIPVGYGDGYPRRFSNTGHVLIHGRRAPIRGRVCMDQMVVEVTDIPGVAAGHVATLIGRDGDDDLTVGGLADALGTTPHEITTCLTARLPRIVAG